MRNPTAHPLIVRTVPSLGLVIELRPLSRERPLPDSDAELSIFRDLRHDDAKSRAPLWHTRAGGSLSARCSAASTLGSTKPSISCSPVACSRGARQTLIFVTWGRKNRAGWRPSPPHTAREYHCATIPALAAPLGRLRTFFFRCRRRQRQMCIPDHLW